MAHGCNERKQYRDDYTQSSNGKIILPWPPKREASRIAQKATPAKIPPRDARTVILADRINEWFCMRWMTTPTRLAVRDETIR